MRSLRDADHHIDEFVDEFPCLSRGAEPHEVRSKVGVEAGLFDGGARS